MKYGNETGHFISDLKGEGFMNGIVGTFIVLAVLVVIVCLIVRSMIKDKKVENLSNVVEIAVNVGAATKT